MMGSRFCVPQQKRCCESGVFARCPALASTSRSTRAGHWQQAVHWQQRHYFHQGFNTTAPRRSSRVEQQCLLGAVAREGARDCVPPTAERSYHAAAAGLWRQRGGLWLQHTALHEGGEGLQPHGPLYRPRIAFIEATSPKHRWRRGDEDIASDSGAKASQRKATAQK